MESEDDTLEVARSYGARTISAPNAGFAEPARQQAIDAASQPWLLVLDADERAAPALRGLAARTIERDELVGLSLPRQNYIFGRWIRHSGYWPDYQMRLFRRDAANWPPFVHTQVEIDGPVGRGPAKPETAIVHEHYTSVREWLQRNNGYTDLEVDRYLSIGRRPSVVRTLLMPPARFFDVYVRNQGFRDGRHGLAIALLMACYAVMVELKLWERRIAGGA